MEEKSKLERQNSSTGNVSDSVGYVMVPSSDSPSISSAQYTENMAELALRNNAGAFVSKFAGNSDDFSDAVETFLSDWSQRSRIVVQESLPSYLVKMEELMEIYCPKLLWLLHVETRFLSYEQAEISRTIASALKAPLKPFCPKLRLAVDNLPEHTYEVVLGIYDLVSTIYGRDSEFKVAGTPSRVEFDLLDCISSVRRWMRTFISPNDTSLETLQFIVAHLLEVFSTPESLHAIIEHTLVKEAPVFETQSDVFAFFRQFEPVERGRMPYGKKHGVESISYADDKRWKTDPPIPNDYKSAMNCPDYYMWIRAVERRISLLNDLEVLTEVNEVPENAEVLETDWSFSSCNIPGARLFNAELMVRDPTAGAADASLLYGPDMPESHESLQRMLSLAVQRNWSVERVEADAAMSYAAIDRAVYVRLPNAVSGKICRLNKAMSGLKDAPRLWADHFRHILYNDLHFTSVYKEELFTSTKEDLEVFILVLGRDVLLFAQTEDQINRLKDALSESLYLISHGFPDSYMSLGLTKLEDGSISIDSAADGNNVLTE